MIYSELDIRLRRRAADSWELTFHFADPASQQFTQTAECHFSPQALKESAPDPAALAQALAARVFATEKSRKIWSQLRRTALDQGRRLRIRLDLDEDAPELHSLPWEGLSFPDDREPLALTRGVLFSRFLPGYDTPPKVLLRETNVQAFLAIAPSAGEANRAASFRLEEEKEQARGYLTGFRALEGGDQPLTISNLKQQLKRGVDVLYFIIPDLAADWTPSQRTLPDSPDLPLLGTRELTAALKGPSQMPKLVVLAGSESAGRGSAQSPFLAETALALLRVGVPAVLTLPSGLSNETAGSMMPVFFEELLKDGQADRALAQARLSAKGRNDSWAPALFMRIVDGRLWQDHFGRRYQVLEPLGSGGMGRVYRVYDRELKREVALKVLRPDLASDSLMIERFKREIQISSTVTHPNVLRVYDFGVADGSKFLTMQYVPGADLASMLQGRTPSISETESILGQICQGLDAAHRAGVVHRDLKPSNIMLDSQGRVFITDFGIAKSTQDTFITKAGSLLGTPAYMSPEQVKGEPVDRRSDIFSLGIILYQMLTGRLPYPGDASYEVLARRFKPPPRVESLNPKVPEKLAKITRGCLAPRVADRYAGADEILALLSPPPAPLSPWGYLRNLGWKAAMLALVVLALGTASAWWISRAFPDSTPAEQAASVPVVGIVPFSNQTGDPALDWFGEGLARLVADNLAGSRHLRVISGAENLIRRSAATADPSATVSEWGVEFLLTGEIFRGAEGLSLAARLSQSSDGRQLSAERIEGLEPNELLKASDRIALAVLKGLSLPLTEKVDVFAADFAASHPEAYEHYVAGLMALKDVRYEDAETAFSAALLKQPDFTMARYQLATALAFSGKRERAVREIRQALAESSKLPDLEARYIRAAEAWFSFREEEAIQAYRELLGLYPFETEARFWLGVVLKEIGRPLEAIEEFETLTRLEPGLHVVWNSLGFRYMEVGDLDRAETALRRYAELEPDAANPHDSLGDLYRRQGKLDLAAQEYETALSLDPDFHGAAVRLGEVDVLRGRFDKAERRLQSVYSNSDAAPRRRIDAAFALTHLRRAQGRFRESAFILETMEKTLGEEQWRQQRSLMFRGLSLMEIGKSEQAGRLIDVAVETSPPPPTHYLFARGLLELHRSQISLVGGTAAEILALEQPSETQKQTAKRAAHYLQGMADLAEQKAEAAIELLTQAVIEPGDDFVIYRLGLARANLAAGRLEVALSEARRCAERLHPSSSALPLELDRVRAVLLTGRIYHAMGRKEDAARQAGRFLELWEHADPGLPDLQEARRLGRQ